MKLSNSSYLFHYDTYLQELDLKSVNASQLKSKFISGELDVITCRNPQRHDAEKAIHKEKIIHIKQLLKAEKQFSVILLSSENKEVA